MQGYLAMLDISSAEQDRVIGELAGLGIPHQGCPNHNCMVDMAGWHIRALAASRAEAWVPGMAGAQDDPMVDELLSRFHSYNFKVAMGRLNKENADLKFRLIMALTCISFYATGAVDLGCYANITLRRLSSLQTALGQHLHDTKQSREGETCHRSPNHEGWERV